MARGCALVTLVIVPAPGRGASAARCDLAVAAVRIGTNVGTLAITSLGVAAEADDFARFVGWP